jgi:hypothetical protein
MKRIMAPDDASAKHAVRRVTECPFSGSATVAHRERRATIIEHFHGCAVARALPISTTKAKEADTMQRFLPKWLVTAGLALSVLVPTVASAAPVRFEGRFDRHYGIEGRQFYRGERYRYGRRNYEDWDSQSRWFRSRRGFYGPRSRPFSFWFSYGGWGPGGRR